eukprot:TRINITY_DN55251_c0_g1_i1.p1 TRINITY_DN55251_c0_g1~~TRINITY_DN55251_c0_g1_i1.p1  ORF type:complete len:408 (+),score=91.03 TRINITY_DN55251_c0_g1_i1:30-1253(+)
MRDRVRFQKLPLYDDVDVKPEASKKKKHELNDEVWAALDGQARPDFFGSISLARDGGLSEVSDLWRPFRWLTALTKLGSILLNIYFVVVLDFEILRGMHNAQERGFLLSVELADHVLDPYGYDVRTQFGAKCIAVAELMGLAILLSNILFQLVHVKCTSSGRIRWFSVSKLFWVVIPELSSYSAMRLLHFVVPGVLVQDLTQKLAPSVELWHVQKCLVLKGWLKLLLYRCFCFVVGFDAFIVKCRAAYGYITEDKMTISVFFRSANFLMQVIGIVQLHIFIRGRLFVFMFAGEDAKMQPRELAYEHVWNAMIAREIFRKHSFLRFLVIMLSFDDKDFQRLVLNEKALAGGRQVAGPSGALASALPASSSPAASLSLEARMTTTAAAAATLGVPPDLEAEAMSAFIVS